MRTIKYIIILLGVLSACTKDIPQVDSDSGIHFYIHSGEEFINKVVPMGEGMAYIGQSGGDAFVMVIDHDGNELWKRKLDLGSNEVFWDATETKDGGLVAVGQTNLSGSHQNAMFAKYDAQGKELWSFYSPDSIYGNGYFTVAEDEDENLWLGGYYNPGGTWYMFQKFDKSSNFLIGQYYSAMYLDFIKSIDFHNNGDVVIGSLSSMSALVVEVRKYQPNILIVDKDSGNLLDYHFFDRYERAVNVNIYDNHLDVFASPTGYTYIASWQRFRDSLDQILFVKSDLAGNIIKTQKIDGLGSAKFLSASETADGGYVICGMTSASATSNGQALVMKLNSLGIIEWESYVGSEDRVQLAMQALEVNGKWLVAGLHRDTNNGGNKMMFYHLNDVGELIKQ